LRHSRLTATIRGTAGVGTLASWWFGDSEPMQEKGMNEFRRTFYIVSALWAACVCSLVILLALRH
jgi:hypothetical protein